MTTASDARRTAILTFLDGRGWTQFVPIHTHLSSLRLNAGAWTCADLQRDLCALVKSGLVEREAVPGMSCRWGAIYSYRRVRS
jgi:hypothetical protein